MALIPFWTWLFAQLGVELPYGWALVPQPGHASS